MPAIAPNPFFAKRRSASEVKSELVLKFFDEWLELQHAFRAKDPEKQFLHIDMLAEPAFLKDGLPLTTMPVIARLVQRAGKKTDVTQTARTFFYHASLQAANQAVAVPVSAHPDALLHPPVLLQVPENQLLLIELLAAGLPAFVLLNPLESGFANQLLQNTLLHSSADLCLFFQADHLKQALSKGKAGKPLQELVGEAPYACLREFFKKERNTRKREDFFLPVLEHVFQEKGFLTLPFRIGLPENGQTEYYLVVASRNKAVYRKLKELLLPYSDYQADGVPVYGTNQHHQQQLLLFPELNHFSILNLMQDLQAKAALYNYKPIDKIAEDHSPATAYIPENYQHAFEKLRDQGKVLLINHKTMQPVKKSTPGSLVKFIPAEG